MNKITQLSVPVLSTRREVSPEPTVRASTSHLAPRFADNTVGRVMCALAEGRTHVAYQPLFRTGDLELVGAEALFRMTDRAGNAVSPGVFMPEVEQSNGILAVTGHVIDTVTRDLSRWRQVFPEMRVAVNVSANDLERTTFVPNLFESLAAYALDVDAIEIEVVERTPIEPGSVAQANLHELSRQGVSISIDDFGCAYADETRLAKMPATKLKLDRSLVQTSHSAGVRTWLADLIAHARDRGMSVVAEGIETEEELSRMTNLGCDYIQGFLLARPKAAAEITGLVGQRAA